jgi:transcriptional regulator with XRE-family HTH domain
MKIGKVDVGLYLKRERIRKGITAIQIANHLGVSSPGYHKMENGAITIKDEYIDKICEFLGINKEEMYKELNDPHTVKEFNELIKISKEIGEFFNETKFKTTLSDLFSIIQNTLKDKNEEIKEMQKLFLMIEEQFKNMGNLVIEIRKSYEDILKEKDQTVKANEKAITAKDETISVLKSLIASYSHIERQINKENDKKN